MRRIKCDEGHPVCKKCLTRGLPCHYTLRWCPPPDFKPDDGKDDSQGLHVAEKGTSQTAFSYLIQPSEWELMQGVHYCMFAH